MEGTAETYSPGIGGENERKGSEKGSRGGNKGPRQNAQGTRPPRIKVQQRDKSGNGPASGKTAPIEERPPVEVNLRSLLSAGVHFGHQTSRWHPAMASNIYTQRNGVHIINLPKTIQCWKAARQEIVKIASNGGSVLFVGTKKQAQDAVMTEAKRSNSFFVSRRWLGGMITNFQTIRRSIERMGKLETTLAEEEDAQKTGAGHRFTKKERLMMTRELEKLEFSLGGIRGMYSAPQLMFVIDIKREEIAVKEAKRLDIPVVALVDTNCDPGTVTYPIPSNDDGTRAIRLFCQAISDAIVEGNKIYQERVARGEFAARDRGSLNASTRRGSSEHARETEAADNASKSADEASAPAAELAGAGSENGSGASEN